MKREPLARKILTWWNTRTIEEAMIPHYEQMIITDTTHLDIVFLKNNTLTTTTDFTIEFENISHKEYDKMIHTTIWVYILFGVTFIVFMFGLYAKRFFAAY